MTIQKTPSHVQAVRRVYDNGQPSTASDTIHLVCYPDPFSGENILLWDDIKAAFDNVVHVRSGTVVLPFIKGANFKNLDPLRIAAVPGVTLDVVVRGQDAPQDSSHAGTITNTAPRRNPVYGLENTAMDNYTHIDKPADIIVLSQLMSRRRSWETLGSDHARPNIAATSNSAARNPVYGDESKAMDNYTHIDNPATAPLRRAPHAILDDQSSSTTNIHTPQSRLSTDQSQPRAPQEQPSNLTKHFTNTMANANLGDKVAQVALGRMYKTGRGVKQDYRTAVEWFLKAANQGYADAQLELGQLYRDGSGVEKDYSTALEWLRKAGEQGHAGAQNEIGNMYHTGLGVPQDHALALEWYLKSAEQGTAVAQGNVGDLYQKGDGIPQDYGQAMYWYTKAAEQGDVESQNHLGIIYASGHGVRKDESIAKEWFLKAASQGKAAAQNSLGVLYQHGRGVPQDHSLALKWYRKGADQGFAVAEYNIGLMYENGGGVEIDRAKALAWYRKAANRGNADAEYRIDVLERQSGKDKDGKKRGLLKRLFN
ncbi:hypothetical protein BG015_002250 [Linnemannia schmuckeri]|uniref:HCP-like protein n=1 Tax=Linnemannia schmuckeri TaxID=64567 RepID=A0A9P5S5T5_9FUNG|nr:hypothetical protein BG015_002250 [Linnemannia schmuckeri]